MAIRGELTAATQHKLGGHEFAVVLADGTLGSLKSGIGPVRTRGPLLKFSMALLELQPLLLGGHFPFGLRW